jgi:hypothetical protein
MYNVTDFFGRRYFRWGLDKNEVFKTRSAHIRVFRDSRKKIIIYEENEFVNPDYDYLVERRNLPNLIEQFTWYSLDAALLFYKGGVSYFTQQKDIRTNRVGFFEYDKTGRMIKEEMYDRFGIHKTTKRFYYSPLGAPLKREVEEVLSEKIINGKIIIRSEIKTYFYERETVKKIMSKYKTATY